MPKSRSPSTTPSARRRPRSTIQDTLDIARRIEREAGSTYRINGREVRARDVQIVFADASTGARSPALVHQGRIGEIIQAKPEQRRRVLEEAAGVAGLHARRHEAELRLKAAETNLMRLEDVIGQLAGQIDGLKKQARQAIRYRTVSAQVRKAEATLYHLRWTGATNEVADAEQRQGRWRARSCGPHRRRSRSLQAPGARLRRAAGLARGRGARRRRPASAQRRAAGARPRGSARQGPHRRARAAAQAIRRRQRARAEARRRRRSGARQAGRRGRNHPPGGARKRRPPQRRRCPRRRSRCRAQRRREDFRRGHHRARRSDRPAQPLRERRARAKRARSPALPARSRRSSASWQRCTAARSARRRGRRRAGGAERSGSGRRCRRSRAQQCAHRI